MDPKTLLSGDQISEMDVPDWRSMYGALEARFKTGDFATGLKLVNAIGEAAEAANHHPDITLTYAAVHVLLTSHDVGGKTQRDVDLARKISGQAAALGVSAEPASVQRAEIGLDRHGADQAVLEGRPRDVGRPTGRRRDHRPQWHHPDDLVPGDRAAR